ncbi:MAG: hypothetical protein IJJ01_02535 [Firmicutes bacterium]|nr:hypothetical protein [Bacillota bacterium]
MQKRTFKQKCLAWLLSLAVAVTFIPMTAGFAFADEPAEPDYYINLEKANVGPFDGNEVKVYINLAEPWQVGNDIVNAQIGTGEAMQAVVDNVSCKLGYGSFKLEDGSSPYFTVDYGDGNWTDPGVYTITVAAKEDAPLVTNKDGKTAKFIGSYTLQCTIVDANDSKNLALAKMTLTESKVPYDGELHHPDAVIVDGDENAVDPDYYELSYPDSTQNAYIKVGSFSVVATAKPGNAGGYVGSVSTKITIYDHVSQLAVGVKNGENGEVIEKKVFEETEWDGLAETAAFKYGYKSKGGENQWTTSKYIPVEKLFSEAGIGEIGHYNDKDSLNIWANSTPEYYNGSALYTIADLKKAKNTADGGEILNVFGGEYSIPSFLILDTEDPSATPMIGVGYGVGYSQNDPETGVPAGKPFCKPVSKVILQSMDINGLPATVANTTYTGKAAAPKVEVKDGDVSVPVNVTCENVNAGEATATITAKEDSAYYGTVTKTFKINKATQTVTVPKTSITKTFGNAAFSLGAKANGGGKLSYSSSNTKVATVSTAGKVTIKGAGTAKITVNAAATSNYNKAAKTITVKVNKAANPMTVKAKTASVKRSKVKKAAQKLSVSKVMTVSNAKGTRTYTKVSGSKRLTISKTTGKVTVKKKTLKGTYKMKVKVSAAGTANYKAGSKTITIKVRVK